MTAYCSKCGAEMPADSQFCPKCGQPAGQPTGPDQFYDMSRRESRRAYRHMRRAARWSDIASPERMLFNTIFGGLFVILLGGLLYLAASGTGGDLVSWSNFWAYLLMGLGGLLLVRGLLEMLTRHYDGFGKLIGGMVLLVVGAAGLTVTLEGWTQYLWIAIIVVGGLLIILIGLLTYLFKR
ncbi:MAG TPA: zinc ribbon domain-containing protein [Methanocella sp.]